MKSGRNIAVMNQEVNQVMARLIQSSIPPDIQLLRVNDLPRQVDTRISDFQKSLLLGIVIVLLVALVAMGWRPALIMATAVPLSMIGSFAVVRYFGIELEQFSIASLIIALGMVVDNAIVVSDNAVRLIREGKRKVDAVIQGAQELAIPLLTSTLTTIAAFLPMLTIEGNAGEYIASLPVVVATTLVISYLVAMLVTPIMAVWLLPERKIQDKVKPESKLLKTYQTMINWCLQRPKSVVAGAVVILLMSATLLPVIGSQFFPAGSRDQFFIKVWLPENVAIGKTERVVNEVLTLVQQQSLLKGQENHRLASAISFIGTGGPRLMITQEPEFSYPNFALILVNTTSSDVTESYAKALRKKLQNYADARITVDQFMLGPPIKDPVSFRLTGPDKTLVSFYGEEMVKLYKQTPGIIEPYSNWGTAANHVSVNINQQAANLAGVSNADIAFSMQTLLSGSVLSHYREGEHTMPIVLRTQRENRQALANLNSIYITGRDGKVPLNALATLETSLQPSKIHRRNGVPTVTVGARAAEGLLANNASALVLTKLEKMMLDLPPGYQIDPDGEMEETIKTQSQVVVAVAISTLVMLLILIVQYNSISKAMVIMAAVPLGLIGVIIGLYLTGWAMGFMAMLGLLSLGGIVINNAIVLIDFIESNIAKGMDLLTAVASAGSARMRPILLTTATTIGGLLPLSLSGEALFAPMTNGMISGLIFATFLTLFVIPSLYVLMNGNTSEASVHSRNWGQ